MAYTGEIDQDSDIYTVAEFVDAVKSGAFIDYDGFGHPVDINNSVDVTIYIKPSRLSEIPEDCNRIVWYNR